MAIIRGTPLGDVLKGTSVADTIFGLAGMDVLRGGGGIDTLWGGTGDDFLFGGAGNDKLNGEAGKDTMKGDAGNDTIKGGAGNDTADGGADNDTIRGEAGNDTLTGGTGNDKLFGDAGDDVLIGGLGADQFFGGGGTNDIADYSAATSKIAVLVDVGGGRGAAFSEPSGGFASGDTFTGIEGVVGSAFDDDIRGDGNANTLIGGIGDDDIKGGGGNDVIRGGADDDEIKGGGGVDTMTGNSGEDLFGFDAFTDSGIGAGLRDIITDFTHNDDIIDIQFLDSHTLTSGSQSWNFIGAAAFNNVGATNGEVRFFQLGGNTIIQLDPAGDGNDAADMEIELTGLITLQGSDFDLSLV